MATNDEKVKGGNMNGPKYTEYYTLKLEKITKKRLCKKAKKEKRLPGAMARLIIEDALNKSNKPKRYVMTEKTISNYPREIAREIFNKIDGPYVELSQLGKVNVEIIAEAIHKATMRGAHRMHRAFLHSLTTEEAMEALNNEYEVLQKEADDE